MLAVVSVRCGQTVMEAALGIDLGGALIRQRTFRIAKNWRSTRLCWVLGDREASRRLAGTAVPHPLQSSICLRANPWKTFMGVTRRLATGQRSPHPEHCKDQQGQIDVNGLQPGGFLAKTCELNDSWKNFRIASIFDNGLRTVVRTTSRVNVHMSAGVG